MPDFVPARAPVLLFGPAGRRGRRQRRGGFGLMGPFPSYSRRTRSGGRVTVSGCCLPIPLALTIAAGVAVRAGLRR